MLEPRPRDVGDAATVRRSSRPKVAPGPAGEAEMSTDHQRIATRPAEHSLGTGRALSSPLLSSPLLRTLLGVVVR
jgi:hypothetical protein